MDKVVIEVPKGQVAKVNKQSDGNVLVTFENVKYWKSITTFDKAFNYLKEEGICGDLIDEYLRASGGSYSEIITKYRIVVAALTNNEKRHLTTGNRWFPVVQFCKIGKEKNCEGNEIIGHIKSEGQKYSIVGGCANNGSNAGLGRFYSYDAVSLSWAGVGFRSVSRRDIAEHLSKYFGRLIFEIDYSGVNCDWEWEWEWID